MKRDAAHAAARLLAFFSLFGAGMPAGTAPSAAHAHKYSVDTWTVEDGLPNHALYSVIHGPDGYLWLAGLAGASRFDGVRFTPILESLPNAHFKTLLRDGDGSVWVGMVGAGLARSRNGRVDSFGPARISGSEVRALIEDTGGSIWAGTESGLSAIDRKGRIENFRMGPVQALARGAEDRVWVAAANGICLAPCLATRSNLTQAAALLEDHTGHLWAGTATGLFSMLRDFSPAPPCANGCFNGRGITALFESSRHEVWAGFDDGGVATPDQEPYSHSDGLAAGSVVSLTEDPEGSIWIASYNGGLERLRPKRVTMYTTADGLPAKVVGSIVEDTSGSIWAGAQCGPVSRLEGERFVPQFAEYTRGACAIAMVAARDGSIWIATDNGPFHASGGRVEHFGLAEGLSDVRVMALFESHDGVIWIGTLRGGLHNYANGHLSRAFGPADGVASGEIENFAEDHDGRVWIGSNGNGLSVYENGRFRILPPAESPPEHDISGLFVDSRNDLWVETDRSGLYRRHQGKWEPFGPERGLNDRLVAGMLEDRAGTLWVSTASSISRIEQRNLEAASLDPIVLDRVDGMLNPEVSGGGFDPTGLVDRAGRLWFSTIDGIAMIDPATFRVNRAAPPVVIESVTTAGKASASSGRVNIPAGGPAVEIRYTGLSFIAPRKVRFRYRIRELSMEWQDAGHNRSVSYPHLPAGSYTFEVIAANNDGIWSKAPAVLQLEVAPFWWERLSVRLLALAMLLAATGWTARYFAARRAAALLAELRRQQELTRERSRIARDIHDDLGARLTRMALMADANETESGGKLATVAREAIQSMDELVWTVNTRNDTVDGFVSYAISYAEEYLRAIQIRVRISNSLESTETELDGETRRHLFLAFKEALNNIVKYAACSEVQLRFHSSLRDLSVRITDNGRGFDMTQALASGGTGLNGMRERIAAIGGHCEITSAPGSGTSVSISFNIGAKAGQS